MKSFVCCGETRNTYLDIMGSTNTHNISTTFHMIDDYSDVNFLVKSFSSKDS